MASSNSIPANLEEKHFGYTPSKKNNAMKTSDTKSFINNESGRHNAKVNPSAQSTIKTDQQTPSKSDSGISSRPEHSNSNNSSSNNDNTSHNSSINSGLGSDIEDNEFQPLPDTSFVRKPDSSIDDNLPSTVTLLRTPDGSKCYLIGTAHFSIESQNDVSKIIQAVQPHIVMVELCGDRIHVLNLDEETVLEEAKNLNFSKAMSVIQKNGVYKGFFYLLLLNMSAHLTKVLGLAPGGEFRRAFLEAKKIPNCMLHMGDRPIKITFARALHSLTWWQTIKLTWQLLTEKNPINQKDIERYKSRDLIEEMMAELAGNYPALEQVFVKERDVFLAHSLQVACRSRVDESGRILPARVVGVVGIGHASGIIENWGKVKRSQIPPIMSIPPPSLTSKIFKYTFKAGMLGVVVYVGYRFIPLTATAVSTLKSSVEGLIHGGVSR